MPSASKSRWDRWWTLFREVAGRLVATPDVEIACRISFQQDSLSRLLLLTASEDRKAQLENMLALFRRLEDAAPGSVRFCHNSDDHDALVQRLPPTRYWLLTEQYDRDDYHLVHDFRILKLVDAVLARAVESGTNVVLQMNFCRFHPGPDDLKVVRKNLIRIEADDLMPRAVSGIQRRIVQQFSESRFLVDQFIACEDDVAFRRICEPMTAAYRESLGRHGFPDVQFAAAAQGELDEQLFTGFHTSWVESPDPWHKLATAVPRHDVLRYLAWQPASWAKNLYPDLMQTDAQMRQQPSTGSSQPAPPRFRVFISCKSEDFAHAERVHDFLTQSGIPAFFSERSLPDLGKSDYRRAIDQCLDQADHLVVVTSSVSNVMSSWVEAEWGFFINEKRSNRKQGNVVTMIAGNLASGELPPALRYYEIIPLDAAGLEKLSRYVR